ncbi:hypothetical protein BDV95DRAFT_282883 [Massariosphaeria phaeospora]|uniref:Uncharacterized protein n=1 Tax=Massariosphaeria phaeospora TaxID=100035 RepID=A0A7C8IC34_9PLEO|nr:hypothetical protein BDV95DRAFT_282883 [Massariosphaeria phaeospora]
MALRQARGLRRPCTYDARRSRPVFLIGASNSPLVIRQCQGNVCAGGMTAFEGYRVVMMQAPSAGRCGEGQGRIWVRQSKRADFSLSTCLIYSTSEFKRFYLSEPLLYTHLVCLNPHTAVLDHIRIRQTNPPVRQTASRLVRSSSECNQPPPFLFQHHPKLCRPSFVDFAFLLPTMPISALAGVAVAGADGMRGGS